MEKMQKRNIDQYRQIKKNNRENFKTYLKNK